MGARTRALIVDTEPLFRARLRAALGAGVDVVGEVPDAAEGVAFVVAEEVDLIVMSLPPAEDAQTSLELLEHDPEVVLVLLNRSGVPNRPGVDARSTSELRGFVKLLVGLGSLPRRSTPNELHLSAAALG